MAKFGGFARWVASWHTKMVITRVPWHFQRQNLVKIILPYLQRFCHAQRGPILIKILGFEEFWGGHKSARVLPLRSAVYFP